MNSNEKTPITRRRWTADQKARIVAETEKRGANVSEIARRNQIASRLIFAWRQKAGCEYRVSGGSIGKMRAEIEAKDREIAALKKRIGELESGRLAVR